MSNLIKERERAHHASNVLNNDIYQESWASLEEQLKKSWEGTTASQTVERERIWQALQLLRKVKHYLEGVIKTGEMAQIQLDEGDPT